MFLDDEINVWWCLRDTWRCDAAEAIGIWAVLLLCATVICTTVVHSFIQHMDGSEWRNEEATRRHLTANDDDVGMVCALLVYFFVFTAGCFAWVAGGVRWVHPFQLWQLQVLGAVGLVACAVLFVVAHVNMGENWSPEPEQRWQTRHRLVTDGVFAWARHPMYAVLLWASISTLLATLNWLIAWCLFGAVIVTFRRIETEERILLELYGDQYLEYRQRVSALGPPWWFLGFDQELKSPMHGTPVAGQEKEEQDKDR